jgi:hypothetical protein
MKFMVIRYCSKKCVKFKKVDFCSNDKTRI